MDDLGIRSERHHSHRQQAQHQLDVLRVRAKDTRNTLDLSWLGEQESGRGCSVEGSLLRRQKREKLDRSEVGRESHAMSYDGNGSLTEHSLPQVVEGRRKMVESMQGKR
jgi:YD repeat-containing protein